MSFDQMEYEDFSRIRWDRMRWDFVNAIVKANQNHVGEDRLFCTGPDCCLDMARMLPVMGITSEISHHQELGERITTAMADGIFMVSTYVRFGLSHPLKGHSEVPWEVARIANSSYFTIANRDDKLAPHVSDKPSDEVRELLCAFVKLAFPDEYLTAVHQKNSGDSLTGDYELDEVPFGWDANARLTQLFESAGYVAPLLSTQIIEGLRGFPNGSLAMTRHFGSDNSEGKWSDIAGYHLGMGMEDASLRRYWEEFESVPAAFVYSEHGNGYGTGMGFIVRSSGLFVSQQVWEGGEKVKWNPCTASFNKYLAPVLERAGETGAAMVIFSEFREDAYIVSSVESSWDEYAPRSAVLGPLPEGFGIVGVWTNYDEARYTPRSFDEIISANWSDQITASAQYLRECLAAMEAVRNQS